MDAGHDRAAPAGYLALGADLLPSGAVAGRAWSSADGSSWLALAPFAEPPFSSISASALGRPGLVVFAVDESSDEAALRGWLLPAQALAGR